MTPTTRRNNNQTSQKISEYSNLHLTQICLKLYLNLQKKRDILSILRCGHSAQGSTSKHSSHQSDLPFIVKHLFITNQYTPSFFVCIIYFQDSLCYHFWTQGMIPPSRNRIRRDINASKTPVKIQTVCGYRAEQIRSTL